MDDWRSYPDFAHLFDALLDANDISAPAFAQQCSQVTSAPIRGSEVNRLRNGAIRPPYPFVADIADHALLSLDPERIRPGGDHRFALFAAAGLIEVTPDSINQWNDEVLARWRRRDQTAALPPILWKELMGKLLSFHCQGGRWSRRDIADAVNGLPGSNCNVSSQRIKNILGNTNSVPTRAERQALETVAGLNMSQVHCIEAAVEDGILPLSRNPSPSRFSTQLSDILGRLQAAGISHRQLASHMIPLGQTEPELSLSTLLTSKNGKTNPTLATLRALVKALERCHDRAHCPLVTTDEIRQLAHAAGFTLDDLVATTHDIVGRINEATQLKPLLSALRNAADLNVAMPAIDSETARGDADNGARMAHSLRSWECLNQIHSPTAAQVAEILTRYNRLLRAGGKPELSSDEIQKVLEVAQRDREDGQQRGFRKRAQEHRPLSPRRTIRPDFDGGHSR
jgi:hypothetical protein